MGKVLLKPEGEVKTMRQSNGTNEKSIIDIILRLIQYIQFIYACEVILRIIELFN